MNKDTAAGIDADQYSRIGGNMKIRLEKPALNNFKAYGWQK